MENLLNCNGRMFRAKIKGVYCAGKIRVEGSCIYLCNNNKDRSIGCSNKFGYKCAWYVGRGDELIYYHVTDFHIVPTAAEIESYKDWQVGDKLKYGSTTREVIFRFGELVVCKYEDGQATNNYTCDELYRKGFRLVAGPDPEDDTVELTMDEIAAKVGVPVEKLRIKKE